MRGVISQRIQICIRVLHAVDDIMDSRFIIQYKLTINRLLETQFNYIFFYYLFSTTLFWTILMEFCLINKTNEYSNIRSFRKSSFV